MRRADLSPKEIAEYHERMLGLYFEDYNPEITVEEKQEKTLSLMKENYPELMEGFRIPEEYNFLKIAYSDTFIDEGKLEEFMQIGFERLMRANEISEELSSNLKNLTWAKGTLEAKLNCLREFQERAKNDNERQIIDVDREVLISSNSFWKEREGQEARLKDDSTVIAADAVGAALGLFGGPLWSIIQGAVVSIAVNEGRVAPKEDVKLSCLG